jgi:rhodanese-related sulfurtransferase
MAKNLVKQLKLSTMKKLLAILMIPLFFLASCKKVEDDPDPTGTSSYKTLTEYMVNNNMDLNTVLTDWIVGAPALADVQTFINTYDILDIRGAADFAAGHIEGAKNTTLADVLTAAQGTTKPILVVCYTGQSASHAVVALRLSGYSAKVLKSGMSGWRADLAGPWEANSGPINGNKGIGHSNWVSTATQTATQFGEPDLTLSGDGAAMLKERVQLMLTNGFKSVKNTDVLDNPGNYFINNYWAQADVDHYGHISNAYRIMPLTIANGEMKNLDPSKTIVTYCWTGQTSSMVTAYLNVIGYNALSLSFGANGMIYNNLESHQFVTPTVDLPVVQ